MSAKIRAAFAAMGLYGVNVALGATIGTGCLNLVYPGNGGSPSYLDANVTFTSGILPSGVYDAYCVNISRLVGPDVYSFTAWEISDPALTSLGLVADPSNLDQVEFILNQAYPGQLAPDSTVFTSDDVQVAIWSLLDGAASLSANQSALNFSQERLDHILNAAAANGEGFQAGCGEIKAYILNPVGLGCGPVADPERALPMFQNLVVGKLKICTDPVEDPVKLTCPLDVVGQVNSMFSAGLVASGGVPPYAFSLESGVLPHGLSLDPVTGVISGVPLAAGSFAFEVKVVDSVGTAGIYAANVTCGIDVSPAPLTAECVASTLGQVGQPYTANVGAVGGIEPYQFGITSGSLPDGLTLDPISGAISGTPTTAGTFDFTLTVTDQAGTGFSQSVAKNCSITVEPPCIPLTVQCVSSVGGTVGAPYSATIATYGGTGPLTYALVSGALPTGLSLDSVSGEVSGTPTVAGVFNFSVEVTDSSGLACDGNQVASVSCGITIESDCPPISLGCVTTSAGKVGTSFTSGLTVTGGVAPYTFTITSGSLPAGLTLNPNTGSISGTPTTAGTFNFTAKVRSASSAGVTPPGSAQTVTVGTDYGCKSRVSVTFYGCSSVVKVCSTKDLSNVVLETCDGTRFKFDGLSGRVGNFTSPNGENIVRVWVKSGCYQCGDGPGFGWRVEGPCTAGNCQVTPPPAACGYDTYTTVSCSITISPTSVCTPHLGCGDTKPHEYWSGYQGQCFIQSLGDGPNCKKLGNWLAAKYPYLWGCYAGSKNLTGKRNCDVASLCKNLSSQYGSKTEAHMLACALSCYVTDSRNCGNSASARGFNVSRGGTGSKHHNVGICGASAGFCNNREYEVSAILDQANYSKRRGRFNSGSFGSLFYDIICKGSRE